MPTVVGIANQKGGVGKSTTALNLCAAFVEAGHPTVLLDADPQGSASRWARQRRDEPPFRVVPVQIERKSAFQRTIEDEAGDVELVVVDLPPGVAEPAMIVALVAELLIVPITPSPFDLWAAEAAIKLVKEAQDLRQGRPLITLLPARIDERTTLGRDIGDALARLGDMVGPPVRERIALREALIRGLTIAEHQPKGPSHGDFTALAANIFDRMGLRDGEESNTG